MFSLIKRWLTVSEGLPHSPLFPSKQIMVPQESQLLRVYAGDICDNPIPNESNSTTCPTLCTNFQVKRCNSTPSSSSSFVNVFALFI